MYDASIGTTSAPCSAAIAPSSALRSESFSATRTIAVPVPYSRPPSVKGSPAARTRMPAWSASVTAAAVAVPHGIRYPTSASGRTGGGAVGTSVTDGPAAPVSRSATRTSTSQSRDWLHAVRS